MKLRIVIALLSFACFACMAQQPRQSAALASMPPMGWNSWNHFGRNVNEADVRAATDALVLSGMRDAGYIYVNIDSGWQGKRDANGVLQPNAEFPDMKALGEYIHSKGLKFGIYSSPGPLACGGYVGSYGHEYQDARMFASWGVDFLKYDLCSFREIMQQKAPNDIAKQNQLIEQAYNKMRLALLATGRPIVFSYSSGIPYVWKWGPQVGLNMWRTSHDIKDNYYLMSEIGFSQAGLSKYAGPGHWNDPDMLEIGNGGMKPDEEQTQMSLWSILAAPLIAGNDLTRMTPVTKSILMNQEVIALDQDPLGKQGDRIWEEGRVSLWSKPLQDGAMAVGLFNRYRMPTRITFRLSDLGWNGPAKARDLWKHEDVSIIHDAYSAVVPSHGVVMLRLTKP